MRSPMLSPPPSRFLDIQDPVILYSIYLMNCHDSRNNSSLAANLANATQLPHINADQIIARSKMYGWPTYLSYNKDGSYSALSSSFPSTGGDQGDEWAIKAARSQLQLRLYHSVPVGYRRLNGCQRTGSR